MHACARAIRDADSVVRGALLKRPWERGVLIRLSHACAQIVTLIIWCAGRFFLYTSYYSIFGALFGFTNFGRMLAIDNTVNGLFGLLQVPSSTFVPSAHEHCRRFLHDACWVQGST